MWLWNECESWWSNARFNCFPLLWQNFAVVNQWSSQGKQRPDHWWWSLEQRSKNTSLVKKNVVFYWYLRKTRHPLLVHFLAGDGRRCNAVYQGCADDALMNGWIMRILIKLLPFFPDSSAKFLSHHLANLKSSPLWTRKSDRKHLEALFRVQQKVSSVRKLEIFLAKKESGELHDHVGLWMSQTEIRSTKKRRFPQRNDADETWRCQLQITFQHEIGKRHPTRDLNPDD